MLFFIYRPIFSFSKFLCFFVKLVTRIHFTFYLCVQPFTLATFHSFSIKGAWLSIDPRNLELKWETSTFTSVEEYTILQYISETSLRNVVVTQWTNNDICMSYAVRTVGENQVDDDDVFVTRVGSFTICLKPLAVIIDLNSLLSLFEL